MLISVIVPTYRNTKEEIERCLGSIYQSDWRDFEVLLVDDGNTTEYAAYLDTLSARFAGLRVLHLPHGGVSAARNAAVLEAQGEYILFSDADDIVTKQFWEDAKEISARDIEADIIYGMVGNKPIGTFSDESGKPFLIWELDEAEKKELYAHFFAAARRKFWTRDGHVSGGPVSRLVRRDFIKSFPFRTNLILGEDSVWNLDMLRGNPCVVLTDHIWYRVGENPESATHRYREDIVERYLEILRTLQDYVTDDVKDDYRKRLVSALAEIATRYYLSPKNSLSWGKKVKKYNQMAWSEPFTEILKINEWRAKEILRLGLYKAGLLLYVYKLKMLLRKMLLRR